MEPLTDVIGDRTGLGVAGIDPLLPGTIGVMAMGWQPGKGPGSHPLQEVTWTERVQPGGVTRNDE